GGHAAQQYVYLSEADLAKVVEALKDAMPHAILYAGDPAELPKAREMLGGAGLTVPLLFGGDAEYLAALEADPKASNGIYLAVSFVLEGGTPEIQDFVKNYQEHFREVPSTGALLAYDGFRVLFQAMRQANIQSAAKVRAELTRFSNEDS